MDPICITTYNLHGFNQCFNVLKDLFAVSDVVFIQEHWLSSDHLSKLNMLTSRFLCFSKSAMDSAVSSTDILRGRPFGGLAVFIYTRLQHNVELLYAAERVLIVKCCICSYMLILSSTML